MEMELDINGDGMVDTVDTTIIARHLSGFTEASLTAGLALGATATTASVVGFLANGAFVWGDSTQTRGQRLPTLPTANAESLPCAVGEVARSAGGVGATGTDVRYSSATQPLCRLPPTSPLLRRGDFLYAAMAWACRERPSTDHSSSSAAIR